MRAPRPGPRATRRRGATIVEVALLLGIFLLFLFGIFEYGRYLMVLHVATNAARDGARYASVNVARDGNFDAADSALNDSLGNRLVSIEEYTRRRMAGLEGMLRGFDVSVFPCDNAKMYQNPPVFEPKPGGLAWNHAQFTERIAVRIQGYYRPVLPTFLFMDREIEVKVTAAMTSEG